MFLFSAKNSAGLFCCSVAGPPPTALGGMAERVERGAAPSASVCARGRAVSVSPSVSARDRAHTQSEPQHSRR